MGRCAALSRRSLTSPRGWSPRFARRASLLRRAVSARISPWRRFSRLPLPEALRLERAVAETSFRLDPFMVESFAMFRAHTGVKVGKYQALMRYPLEG